MSNQLLPDQPVKTFWSAFKNFFESDAKYVLPIAPLLTAPLFFLPSIVQNPETVQIVLSGMNIFVLSVWLIWGNKHYKLDLEENDKSYENYSAELRLETVKKDYKKTAKDNTNRVNDLVDQLRMCVMWYAYTLIIVYIVFIIDSSIKLRWEDFYSASHPYIKILEDVFNFLSAVFLYLGFRVLYDKIHESAASEDDIETSNNIKKDNKKISYKPILVTGFSLLCLVYVVNTIVFQTSVQKDKLPGRTIDDIYKASSEYVANAENTAADYLVKVNETAANVESNSNDGNKALKSINEVIRQTDEFQALVQKRAATRIETAINSYKNGTKMIWPNVVGLFVGCANAFAMLLLFGRYISMDHLVNETKEGNPYTFITSGAVFFLPVYALVQPLFGSFEIDTFGNNFAFANYVFFICFIGKIFFLFFTWYFMQDRAMHYYLHSVISYHGIPDDLQRSFKQCSKMVSRGDSEKEP